MRKPTAGSLFSGIGGLDLAAQWAGFETAWFVEKELFCQRVLAKHWPDVPIHSDVFDCHNLPHVDVIVGGFPCQPFSLAGKRQGANDERFLLPEMLRIISEVQPYAVLFENVPGFPSLNDGAEFKQLLGALAEMGLDAEWGHLRASDFGAPHQRERWFCVAYAASIRCQHDQSFTRGISRSKNKRRMLQPAGTSADMGNTKCGGCNGVARRWADSQLEDEHCQSEAVMDNADGKHENGWGYGACIISQHEAPRLQRSEYGQPESRLGGNVDGLPGGVDFAGWPARPNEPQYAYEPPRVSSSAPNRTARLKALGNAVVPQAAYPLMIAIREWLENNYA